MLEETFGTPYRPNLCTMLDTNFYEKALFVKPTWRLCIVAKRNSLGPFARYASIRTVSEPALFGDSVHRMRSVFSD
jgi:hypothetical protein